MKRPLFVSIALALVVAACASPNTSDVPDAGTDPSTTGSTHAPDTRTSIDIMHQVRVWTDQVGLRQTDEAVWADRIAELCVTDEADFADLGADWAMEDAEYSVRDDGTLPGEAELQDSLWVMKEEACSAEIPPPLAALRPTVFDVDGVEVVAVTRTGGLPDQASVVQFTGTLIDDGDGPMICMGGVAESLPPQCSGPIVDDLDTNGWTDEAQGVRWGERTVDVTWPPVDGHVTLVASTEPVPTRYTDPVRLLPDVCAGERTLDRYTGSSELHEYAQSLGSTLGGVWVTEEGRLVLQVTDDPQPHRDALAAAGGEACVVRVDRTEAELLAAMDGVSDDLFATGLVTGMSSGPWGRIDLFIPVADRDSVTEVASYFDDPTILRVYGDALIVE